MNHQHEPKKTTPERKPLADYTPEEQAVIRSLERECKRELTAQEVHLALGQARAIGTLEDV
jgi:hypothetical protein